jgi:quercetin dioxygenase-like cupin family protein
MQETTLALPHAHPLDVIDLPRVGPDADRAISRSLIKTETLQLLHLVLRAGREQPDHHVDDACTVQCLDGEVDVLMPDDVRRVLRPGQLVVLPGRQRHALRARADSSLLVTLLLHHGDAGHDGGTAQVRQRDSAVQGS